MKKHLLLALLSAMLVGCSLIEDAPPTPNVGGNDAIAMVAVADTSSMVTLDNIQQIIASTSLQSRSARTVKEIRPITGAYGDTMLYVVNYTDNQGFDIVSASKEYNPLLATADEGNFPIDTDDTAIGLWIQGQCHAIENIDQAPDSLRTSWRLAWERATAKKRPFNMKAQSRFLDEFDDYTIDYVTQMISQWNAQGFTVYTLDEYRNTYEYQTLQQNDRNAIENAALNNTWPYAQNRDKLCFIVCNDEFTDINCPNFVDVKWGQTNGFNNYTPIHSSTNAHCPVGCGPLAIGQILRHYEHAVPNMNLQWNLMDRYAATNSTALLLSNIGQTISANYRPYVTTVTLENCKNGLVNSFGCTQAKISSIDYNLIKSQLNQHYPLIVEGFISNYSVGHAWLYTGYKFRHVRNRSSLHVLTSHPGDAPNLGHSQMSVAEA